MGEFFSSSYLSCLLHKTYKMFYLNKLIFGDTSVENDQKDKVGEQLEIQVVDDWVVVHPCGAGGFDILSQGSANSSPALDEFLDDADSLATSLNCCGHGSHLSPLHDCGNVNFDMDSDCSSSDTESTPESVFSASSGRSHATYRPRGNASEPWVVAPAPCFTGSQVGEIDTVSRSPLENLLIEHPSMSVYLSMPQLCQSKTHHFPSIHLTGEGHRDDLEDVLELPVINIASAESGHAASEQVVDPATLVQTRSRLVHAVLSPGIATPEHLIKRMHSAQRNQCCKSKKIISNRRCQHQNKVYEYQGHTKANNRRNKRSRPSGFRSSRITQRM
ncbi:hypothetical protein Btru_041607 [Bulinus truncatus]|nr:hypothetical protein Btru_041607 [Bulinus truncatus]